MYVIIYKQISIFYFKGNDEKVIRHDIQRYDERLLKQIIKYLLPFFTHSFLYVYFLVFKA